MCWELFLIRRSRYVLGTKVPCKKSAVIDISQMSKNKIEGDEMRMYSNSKMDEHHEDKRIPQDNRIPQENRIPLQVRNMLHIFRIQYVQYVQNGQRKRQ